MLNNVGGLGGGAEKFLTQVENLPNETGMKGGSNLKTHRCICQKSHSLSTVVFL